MTANVLGQDKYDKYVGICNEGILARTNIREPLYLGDKPIEGILKDLDEGYGPNYMEDLGFSKIEFDIRIYAFINSTPQKQDF